MKTPLTEGHFDIPWLQRLGPLVNSLQIIRLYSVAEAIELAKAWLSIYDTSGGTCNVSRFMWHVFSGKHYPCLKGLSALAEYGKQEGTEFVVLSNKRDVAFTTATLPSPSLLEDFYVFPSNMAWTMAFTHEGGWLGPYFAKHRKYDLLNAGNRAQVKKAKEKVSARRNGWT